ncbi:GtrA family protein [Carnobacterium sp. TMP28]|uniref:GtrA family protein n=1 Tax=Carnobacterium sp. TMP28 TaxID=3397060 RepID=UPI0039E090C4
MKNTLVLIPALNPTGSLISYVDELIKENFDLILVINDGSSDKYQSIFIELTKRKEVTVHRHIVNLGKGRALKNGFNYFMNLVEEADFSGVITVDSDGQHSVEDVIRIREVLTTTSHSLILGSRNFDQSTVPFKSKFGNKLTSKVFQLLYGIRLMDTQTGLRALTTDCVASFIPLAGERFEYETNMLIEAAHAKIPIQEIEIETIYMNDNSETHFDPINDSLKIYGALFKTFFNYMASSMLSFSIDIAMFQFFILSLNMGASSKIVLATVGARISSSLFNYLTNKKIVFKDKSNHASVFWKYFGLVMIQMLSSALLVALLYSILQINETGIKVVVDSLLFFVSFRIQKRQIFNG